MPLAIAVGRRFGSGGRELAKALAKRLDIRYLDRELLEQAALDSGLASEFLERHDERFPKFVNGIFSFAQGYLPTTSYAGGGAPAAEDANSTLARTIADIASKENAVFVGRTADYVLRDHPGLVSVFVHAPIEACVERILKRQPGLTTEKARSLAEKTNKLRANYYNFYTDKRWGDSSSYDLCLDSSRLPMEECVELVVDYIRRRHLLP